MGNHRLSDRKDWQKHSHGKGDSTDARTKRFLNESLELICEKYPNEFEVLKKEDLKVELPFSNIEGSYKIVLDAGIRHIKSGNPFFIEGKGSIHADAKGNAHIDRACKLSPTAGEVRLAKKALNISYIPIAVVLTEGLTTDTDKSLKKQGKALNMFHGYEDFLLIWKDYDHELFEKWFENTILPRLRGDKND